jgi:hypothetical protein
MGTDNEVIGRDWRTRGMRVGLISVMAATGMVLAGQAAEATTATPSLKAQADGTDHGHANGDGQGLPPNLPRLADGNSGASCFIDPDSFVCLGETTSNNGGSTADSSTCQSSIRP